MKDFWKEFAKADNSMVHSPYIIGAFLIIGMATPVAILSMVIIVHNVWWLHRPLDGPMVQLLGILMTAATTGIASALFARSQITTMFSQQTGMMGSMGVGPVPPGVNPNPPMAKPAPTAPGT